MTKRQALKILKLHYSNISYSTYYIKNLCSHAPLELRLDWCKYWNKINKNDNVTVHEMFAYEDNLMTLASITRLMLLFHFVEDTYK